MGYYEIITENHIDQKRLKDFDGMNYQSLPDGKTLLTEGIRITDFIRHLT